MLIKSESEVLKMSRVVVIIVPLLLVACASQPEHENIKKSASPSTSTKAEPIVKSVHVNEVATAPQAVFSLIERSQQQLSNDDLKGASASLERAIRISPRYPDSYYYLAKVRYLEGRNAQARSLAKKTLSLGAQDSLLEKVLVLLDNIHESEGQ